MHFAQHSFAIFSVLDCKRPTLVGANGMLCHMVWAWRTWNKKNGHPERGQPFVCVRW